MPATTAFGMPREQQTNEKARLPEPALWSYAPVLEIRRPAACVRSPARGPCRAAGNISCRSRTAGNVRRAGHPRRGRVEARDNAGKEPTPINPLRPEPGRGAGNDPAAGSGPGGRFSGRPAVPDGPAAPRGGTGRQGDRRGPGAAGCRSGGTGNGGRPSAPEADPKGAGRQPAGRKDCNSSSGRAALFAGKRMECGRRSEGTRVGAVAREAGKSGERREKTRRTGGAAPAYEIGRGRTAQFALGHARPCRHNADGLA